MDVVKEDMYGWCERRLVRDSVRWRQMACCGDPWWIYIYFHHILIYICIYIYISKIQFLHCILQTTLQFIMTTSFDSAACDAESAELSQQRSCCAGETVMTAILNYWAVFLYRHISDNTSADQYDAYETGDMPIWPYSRCLALFNMSCLKSLILSQWKKIKTNN